MALTLGAFAVGCGDSGDGGNGGSGAGDAGGNNAGGSDTGGSGGADACEGGIIIDGVCEGKCTPDKCLEGNTCVGNQCVLVCDSHLDCRLDGTQSCLPAVEDDTGADITTCQDAGQAVGAGLPCPFGAECAEGFECVSAGAGDAEAYCVNRDCTADDECSAGFYCGIIRDPHGVCDTNPPKGDNTFCGTTTDPCIDVDDTGVATDGSTRFEGSSCMLRRSCLKRDQGAPCATDLDCSRVENQICTTYAGESRCSRTCGNDDDCTPDNHCDATTGACVPRFEAWVSSTGGFCEPCFTDEDCGDETTTKACVETFGGARACLDRALPDVCNTSADCPASPSGKHGYCLDENLGVSSGDPVFHHCYLPFDLDTYQASCW
ncbi:MAG: hypothetical protein HOW73_18635 [Polyangiaceae bacterium]|nr:hypothetical protein [Polyangiaceae bacterium]